jgi:hypothetical protein
MLGLIFHKKVNKSNQNPPSLFQDTSSYFDHKPNKKQLVAHWVTDENNKLSCQWVFK